MKTDDAAFDRLTKLVSDAAADAAKRELERIDELPDRTRSDARLAGLIEKWLAAGAIVQLSMTLED